MVTALALTTLTRSLTMTVWVHCYLRDTCTDDGEDTIVRETSCLFDAVESALAFELANPAMRTHIVYQRTDSSFCNSLSRDAWGEYV